MKLIKIPFGGGGLGKGDGAKDAPDCVIECFKELNINEAGLKPKFEIETIKIDNKNLSLSHNNIFDKIKTLSEKALIIGGDHSISYPCFKAFASNNRDAGLVVFDAHPDLMESAGVSSQEDWLRSLINEGIVDKKNVILIGLRNWDGQEKEFLELNKIKFFTMKHIFSQGIDNICDTVMENVRKWSSFYLSIDIDAVDPAFAPGTGYQEPAGLSSRELIYFIQRLKLLKNMKMMDLVEINPEIEDKLTPKLGAKILFELF